MGNSDRLNFYYQRMSELYRVGCINALLGWDQRVYMPQRAAEARAGQLEFLTLLAHSKSTDPEFMKVVDELYESLDSLDLKDKVNIRESKRVLDIQRKLPEDFVSEEAKNEAITYSAWVAARPPDDFKTIQPLLEKTVELARRKAELIGYEKNPYDALLDLYEPGAKTAHVKPLLLGLGEELRNIIPQIYKRFSDMEELQGHFATDTQHKMCTQVSKSLGFSFDSGRIDVTAHPFMSTLGPADFRITTRYFENNFLPALYGTIHETGHALYELGLPYEHAGTPMGEAVSLGIHESQSRLWENLVGRSREFCSFLCGTINEYFPGANLKTPIHPYSHTLMPPPRSSL